jgi:succinoglycan biosynthesis protein ExoO
MTNVLFISRQRVVGRTNGSSVYLLDLAGAVRAAGMTPHLLQPSPTLMGRWPVLRLKPEMKVFATHDIRGVWRFGDLVVSRDWRVYLAVARAVVSQVARRLGVTADWAKDRPLPYAIAIPWTKRDRAFVRKAAKGKADIAIADYMFQAEGFASLPDGGTPTAIAMHDLFHARAARSDSGVNRDSVAEVDREREIAMLARADAVIAIQATEAAFVAEHVPDTQAILAPMAAHPVATPQPGNGDRLLFVGSNTAPNVIGLQWLFDEVWPIVRAAWPEARLDVAGTVARAFPAGGPPGVRFLGLVDDLDALYAEAGIVISPLTFGSGLKIKLIEAMAQGKAIVATSITLQGAERECEGAVALADEPKAFASAILKLHADHAVRAALATAAWETARRHFSPEACYGVFIGWLKQSAAVR